MNNTYNDLYWQGKPLRFTRHALEELEESSKNADAVLEVLEKGTHVPESKEKTMARFAGRKNYEVVYIEYPDRIKIIHVRL